jgi:hypothetical protein
MNDMRDMQTLFYLSEMRRMIMETQAVGLDPRLHDPVVQAANSMTNANDRTLNEALKSIDAAMAKLR